MCFIRWNKKQAASMRALFVHSHSFGVDSDGTAYSPGKLPYSAWSRYLKHADQLVVLARCHPREQSDRDLSSGPRVEFDWLPALNRPLAYLREMRRTRNIIRRQVEQSDAVIVRLSPQGWIAAEEACRLNRPWAVEMVGDPWDSYWQIGGWKGKLYAPFAWLQARRGLSRAPFAIYVTQKTLQRRYPCPNVVSSVSNVQIPDHNPGILEARLNFISIRNPNRPIVIGMIGALNQAYKGHETAMAALKLALAKQPLLRLQFIGEGHPERWLRMARQLGLENRVAFLGTLQSGSPVREWLDTIDLYIQPSYTEGLPRALVEAMSRGCPALASSAGGIPELLAGECLHRPGDHRTLARQIIAMIAEAERQRESAARNFSVAGAYAEALLTEKRSMFWQQFFTQAARNSTMQTNPSGKD